MDMDILCITWENLVNNKLHMQRLYILHILITICLMLTCTCQGPKYTIPGLNILLYGPSNITIQSTTAYVYSNNTLNNSFLMDENALDCSNLNVYVLNRTPNSNFSLIFVNYNEPFYFDVFEGYGSNLNPIDNQTNCATATKPQVSNCSLTINSNCSSNYSNYLITSNVYTNQNNLVTTFKFYVVCSYHPYQYIYQIQWGLVFIVVISIIMMFTSSKFQEAHSISNFTLFVNYYVVAIYSVLCMTKFLLLYYAAESIIPVINIICLVGTVVFGILSSMLCFSQACYATKIKVLRWGIEKGWFKWRVMDAIGVVFGIGMLCLWYFLYTNWITSDIIFVMIYLSMIKVLKFGSLKIAILTIVLNFIIDCIFYQTIGSLDNTYQNAIYNFYNNPLFLITPNLTHIPNRKCTWYFVISMSFAGLLCAYLQRFDKNKSSIIYSTTFVVAYSIGAILWLVISIFVPISLPYDLFTVPGAIILLIIFANRRGQLKHLWRGDFYDQQKDSYNNQKQISQQLKNKNRNSVINKSLFDNLKYQENYSVADTTRRQGVNFNLQNELKQVKEKRKSNQTLDNYLMNKERVQRSTVWKSEMPRINIPPPPPTPPHP